MSKPRKNKTIQCKHFLWRLTNRNGKWYADGRSNTPSAGRHSLGTSDEQEAINMLADLDRVRAEDLGLIPRSKGTSESVTPLPLADGRKLYEKHIARPRIAGGVQPSTRKRYRTVFDKFIPFAESLGIAAWNAVSADVLTDYAAHLESNGYAYKTQTNELTTLKQAVRWFIDAGHLQLAAPIKLKLRRAESESPYCYRPQEVNAIVQHCRGVQTLRWLGHVAIGLACTGLRISELASVRWSDVDLTKNRLSLTDETARSIAPGANRRFLKSGRSRSFPIHQDLVEVLGEIRRIDQFIFHGPRGGRIKPDTVRRVLVRDVLEPLANEFPTPEGEKGFIHGRLHSFRHYFCSTCANNGVPERMVMDWLGHADSKMIRHYYHLHDEESQRRMNSIDFLGGAGGRSAGRTEQQPTEGSEPTESPDT